MVRNYERYGAAGKQGWDGFIRIGDVVPDVMKEVARRFELRQRLEADAALSAIGSFSRWPNAPEGSSCESPERG